MRDQQTSAASASRHSPPITTIKARADFLRLNRGRKSVTPFFILRSGPGPASDAMRVGYTVTTKCGNAVVRNRIKRRLRALVRELLPELGKPGTDYVFIALAGAKPSAGDVAFDELRVAMKRVLA